MSERDKVRDYVERTQAAIDTMRRRVGGIGKRAAANMLRPWEEAAERVNERWRTRGD